MSISRTCGINWQRPAAAKVAVSLPCMAWVINFKSRTIYRERSRAMDKSSVFNRLSVRLTVAFLLAAIPGVALVAILAYRSTSSDFGAFLTHIESMEGMMGGGMMDMMGGQAFAQAERDFLNNLGQTLLIASLSGVTLAIFLGTLFTRQIVAPLGKVTAAARSVAQGNLKQRVDIGGSSELAELGESFNTMAATLSRDQEVRQNMVADIAHELRTPLSILQGNVEAMLDGVLKVDTENLTSLHEETILLARLVEDLRTLSLAETGQLRLQMTDVDLNNLSLRVIDGFQTQFAAKKIKAVLEAPANLPLVQADPERTSQVIRNLLNNAWQYTAEGGSITMRLVPDGDGVTVSVIDTGVGIRPDDLPYVFDRFYRVDRSRTRSTGGSGLGLTIVKQLVEGQQGRVWVQSEFGKGSTFSFHLPASSS
ncbi:MAG: HAMP domain-containing protein [Chloroflexi bacterium]|nr:HAMP domain-containing protein [Chloroflexota bacterium]